MNGLNGPARLLLRLANWIAGPDREEWVLAMAVEADAADGHGTRWALGCLFAAGKDRLARDWRFVAAIVMLPILTMVLGIASAFVIFIGAQALKSSVVAEIPLMLLEALPAAWVLGRMRPDRSPVLIGTIAFLIYLAVPLVLMWAVFGIMISIWSADAVYYNLPAYAGLPMSWLVWIVGTWWGASIQKRSVT